MARKTQASSYDFANNLNFGPLNAFNGPIASSMLRSSEVFAKGMQTMPAEIAGFIGRRVKTDAKLFSDCAKCDGWDEVVSLQQNWLKQTSEDYMKEANQMMALSQTLLSDAAKAAIQAAKDETASRDEKAAPTE